LGQAVITIVPLAPEIVQKFDVVRYDVRYSPGPTKYDTNDENAVGDMAVTDTTFQTNVGLAAPGSVAFYRVYAFTSTGNERGSATIKIIRT
jgi:hypothetical protein